MQIEVSSRFQKSYKKLSAHIKQKAKEKERIFRQNPFDSRLKTHKLHGKECKVWAFWIDYTYRIKFIFLKDGEILFLDVGTHDIYQ